MRQLLLAISILFCVNSFCMPAKRWARRFEAQVRTMNDLAYKTDRTINYILRVAEHQLLDEGFKTEAMEARMVRLQYDGFLLKKHRDIGDFDPLIKALANLEKTIEAKIGYTLAHAMRLDDLTETINFSVPYLFGEPCSHGLYEFTAHFCGDAHVNPNNLHPRRGLVPVVSYWSTVIGCSFAIPIPFICGPIAMLAEWFVDADIAPVMAPKIYNLECYNDTK